MKVRLNGVETEIGAKNLRELLDELEINPQKVVVEVNLQIVKRDRLSEYEIKDGDSIEIVNFVGGG